MRNLIQAAILLFFTGIFSACVIQNVVNQPVVNYPKIDQTGTPAINLSTGGTAKPSGDEAIFTEATAPRLIPTEVFVTRARFVHINLSLLIAEDGSPRILPENFPIMLNLFPDVVYTGIIVKANNDELGYSWTGYLKDVQLSELTMVYTSGVFTGHFASPVGIYEVSFTGDNIYQVIQIDQQKLPGGE